MMLEGVATNDELARLGRLHGLDTLVVCNPGTVSVSPRMLATAVEAVFGAVYLDGGPGALDKVINLLGISHALVDQ